MWGGSSAASPTNGAGKMVELAALDSPMKAHSLAPLPTLHSSLLTPYSSLPTPHSPLPTPPTKYARAVTYDGFTPSTFEGPRLQSR